MAGDRKTKNEPLETSALKAKKKRKLNMWWGVISLRTGRRE